MRFFRPFVLFVVFAGLVFATCKGASQQQSPTGQPPATKDAAETPLPPQMDPPPKAPFELTDADEIEIHKASDRLRFFLLSKKESEEKLTEYQVKLSQCDQDQEKKNDQCHQRIAVLYVMLIGDRYAEQKKYDDALAFYLEATKRLFNENQRMESEFEHLTEEIEQREKDETAKTVRKAFESARFHFQAYKDFGEFARYQKRIIELFLKTNQKEKADSQWPYVRESIRTSAEHKKTFLKDLATLSSLKDKLPEKLMEYYKQIADMSSGLKIENI